MTPFGAHAFIWAGEWTLENAELVISSTAESGLDFVEIPILRPETIDITTTRALLKEYGIGCTCSLGLPDWAHLPFVPDKAEDYLKRTVDIAAGLGADALSGALYTNLGTLTGEPPTEEEMGAIVRTLKRVARYAAEKNLQVGIEAVNRYESYLINLAEQLGDVVDRIDEPNVFAHLDTYHMNIEEKGFYEPIATLGAKLKYIHLSESDRGTPGTGNVHWDDAFKGLHDIGFEGQLVMESFVAINKDIAGATAIWRDVVGDPEVLIRDGLSFLRGKAAEYGISSQ